MTDAQLLGFLYQAFLAGLLAGLCFGAVLMLVLCRNMEVRDAR